MQVSRTAVVIAGPFLAGLLLLAACGPKPGGNATNAATNAAGGGSASSGAAPAGGDQAVNLGDLPHPRGGQWQETLDDGDGKPDVTTTCLSGRTPAMKVPPGCSQFTFKRTMLGAYVMDMSCSTEGNTMTAHGEMSGDFQNSATSDMTMTMAIAGQPPRTIKMHTDMKYIGPCAPGQTPDDAPDTNTPG
ncbi:MAG TPA: DUF3617 family protein [Caulobacteraceae bacterium]|jgi:hypothetical protein|nr:DUF3617 family protein [Caulobacteraceae bacterium]